MIAHVGGLGWDELVLIAIPVVVLAVLQVLGRRKARATTPPDEDGAGLAEDEEMG
ncbi:MAG: hypothetical protein M3Q68_10105 [Actinomycetota bacterium]|nr:hypothetical protein [Actinomycetota bacterium]